MASATDIAAYLALGISVLALSQATRFRRNDNLFAARLERAELHEAVKRLSSAPNDLEQRWKAAYAYSSSMNSGGHQKRRAEVAEIKVQVENLRTGVDKVPALEGFRASAKAEGVRLLMIPLRARANALDLEVQEHSEAIEKMLAVARANRRPP